MYGSPLALTLLMLPLVTGCLGSLPTPDERVSLDRVTYAIDSLLQWHVLADRMIGLNGTLDPNKTEAENAQATLGASSAALGGCGSVAWTDARVTVQFGQSPGCVLTTGEAVTGAWQLDHIVFGGVVNVAALCAQPPCLMNGAEVLGYPQLTTTDGILFKMTGAMQSPKSSNSFSEANVAFTASSGTLDDTFFMDTMLDGTTGVATTIAWNKGDCSPHVGSVQVTGHNANLTLTYSTESPTTGHALVETERGTVAVTLPSHGSCTYSAHGG